ncbi:MAG: FAD-dependent oxidoreductase [Nakamurella sp.]
MTQRGVVIVGAGQAGVQCAVSIRETNAAIPIVLISDEAGDPYHRPQLSKEFMTATENIAPLELRTRAALSEHGVDFRAPCAVTSINTQRQTVDIDSGVRLEYSDLVLATGSRNRSASIPGVELDGVYSLRTLPEASAIRGALSRAARLVVVGAGFIGLELASAARARGLTVTVIDIAERPMARMLSEQMSQFYLDAHTADGIAFRLGDGVDRFEGRNGRVCGVVTSSGELLAADFVIVAVGIHPNVELAQEAGLAVDNGIVVDGSLRTSASSVWAIGDCASVPHPLAKNRIRLESVQNAADQAEHLGHRLSGADVGNYHALPWFWSFQGALRLQIAGLIHDPDEVVIRGDPQRRRFSAFCFRNEQLQGVESLNTTPDHMAARRILAHELALTPAQAADLDFDLKTYSRTAGSAA